MHGRLLLPLAVTALVASGCSALTGGDDATNDGQVAVAFYPLEYVASLVGGDHVDVETLTAPGQEPHDADLSVARTAAIADAALVVHESGFQPAIDRGVAQNAQGRVLDVTDVVDLLPYDDHGHEHAEGEEHDHDHGDVDPHFWLDPLLMADVADAVADELSELDPDHADDFASNADDLRAELTTLDEEYADGLASCERDTVVVNHDAFGYLSRYGLHFEAVVGLSPGAEATIADQQRLQQLVRDEGITTVFSERLASNKSTRTLAEDAGVGLDVLDPIEGLSDETADEDYLSLMRTNLTKIREANGC